MVERPREGRAARVRPTGEDDRVTTFELFFDLVYIFAATQVTGYMAHAHSGHGVLRGCCCSPCCGGPDAPGGLDGPLVLVGAYLLVRCVHLTLYGVAAAGDRGLWHQLAISWGRCWRARPCWCRGRWWGIGPDAAVRRGPFKQRMHRTLSLPRLVVVETARYAQARRSLRNP